MSTPPIHNRIRRLRFDHNEMTQQVLADRAGVTRQTIIAIEGGRYTPSLDLAFRIADVFGAGIETVFFRAGGTNAPATEEGGANS